MSRPRNPDLARHAVQIRLPGPLLDRLDDASAARVLSRNKLIELLLERGLSLLPPVPDDHPEAS